MCKSSIAVELISSNDIDTHTASLTLISVTSFDESRYMAHVQYMEYNIKNVVHGTRYTGHGIWGKIYGTQYM